MTRVAHVVAAPEFSRLILRHEMARVGEGIEHVVICSPGPDLDQLEAEGVRVIRVPIARKLAPGADLVSLGRLTATLRRLGPDLVHTYTPKAGLLGQLAAWAVGIRRRVHACRGLLYHPGLTGWRRGLFRFTDRITCALAERVLFVSGADLAALVEGGLCRREKARLTGNGIDPALFERAADADAERRETRRALGIADDEVMILTVGRYVAEKGYLDLAAAIPRLTTPLDRLRFVWVAPLMGGEDGGMPADLLAAPPLAAVVQRLGRRDDLRRLYQAADLLVHPSHREGVPRVLMEAAVAGLPIAASDIPGNREVVSFGTTAFGFPAGNPGALATALDQALAARSSWGPMAEAARADVLGRMDVARVAERVAGVYRELGVLPAGGRV